MRAGSSLFGTMMTSAEMWSVVMFLPWSLSAMRPARFVILQPVNQMPSIAASRRAMIGGGGIGDGHSKPRDRTKALMSCELAQSCNLRDTTFSPLAIQRWGAG
ncbi:hypothetical protein F4775DRAFT_590382 [Biscogniauxia sp. FL1348]|nr:hypothetical protein F4775DRAFT_590382 [Biscogniauxia sp. FL1348]